MSLGSALFVYATHRLGFHATRTAGAHRRVRLALGGALAATAALTPWPGRLLGALLLAAAVTVWWSDGGWFDIPDRLTVPFAGTALLIAALYGPTPSPDWGWAIVSGGDAVAGLVAGAGFGALLLWLGEAAFGRPALGFGDVTLLAAIGASLGATQTLAVIPIASVIALAGISLGTLSQRWHGRAPTLPASAAAIPAPITPTSPVARLSDTRDPADSHRPEVGTVPDDVPAGAFPFGGALMIAALCCQWIPWQHWLHLGP